MISKNLTALSMILACAAAACGGSDDKPAQSASDVTTTSTTAPSAEPTPAAAPAPEAAPAAAPAPAPAPAAATYTDAQIAGIVMAVNKGEIDQAKTAQKNAKNAKVKAFAGKMVADHTDADKKEQALLKKKKITSADSDKSAAITSDGSSMNDSLKAQKGADFDKSYLDGQVKMHQQALDLIDNTLLAQVQDTDMKDLLTAIRGKVADHLKMAQDLQSSM